MKKKSQNCFSLRSMQWSARVRIPRWRALLRLHLVAAGEHGLPTHGMSRVPFYCSMLKNGAPMAARVRWRKADSGAVILIDNADGLPYESCAWAIAEVISRARRNGSASPA
jgi:LDH2 family malate/lactate/ureidoglycolate dehydrogenase